ncbi:DEAD/DEAH box helicase family protein [Riemerella anatipestifer]|uniref:DEAD/DEAH box helicase family protein n=1 Tax=Riemerella anatipestifer TaxID=34085 RepID=UPI0030C54005
MTTNFAFLKNEFKDLYEHSKSAEQNTFTQPRFCLISCRITLEKAMHWLYDNDEDLHLPYQKNLAALMYADDFKNIVKPSMFRELVYIQKIGNRAAHGEKVTAMEALQGLKNLFRFLSWVSKYYSQEDPEIPPFEERYIPYDTPRETEAQVIQDLENKSRAVLEKEEALIRERQLLEQERKDLRKEREAYLKLMTERKQERTETYQNVEAVPELTSEKETRRLLIDLMLKEAGWGNLQKGINTEYPVEGMPASTNPSGKGFVDYVLWDDNGKPLAVIEAKKASYDAANGKHQASLYADALERKFGQRPLIFYTNGYEVYFWDDTFYTPRSVYGFFNKKELQTLIKRRKERSDIRQFQINQNIAGRPYQLQAIQRVAETLVGEHRGNLRGKSRKALLVMATGSGKTRTSAAMVDMFTKCNWAKRILFLADRNALVTQAKNAFKEHLPHLSAIDLTQDKDDGTARVVFSTYPTMMNRIDQITSNGERQFSIGHFDVIIIDEAHRSVYQKYQAIFDYFDAILIGLTATPKKDIDRNTYQLFEIEDDNPTFAYELDTAVKEGFLVPPKALSVPVKYVREGIKYKELNEKDKAEIETLFGLDSEENEDFEISKNKINSSLFNTDTVDKVLSYLMEKGLKVESGDKLGKTIIFAKNHNHAVFIEERFNKMYPEYGGTFLRVIDNYEDKAQNLLENFCFDKGEEKDPQIAVSVDMMDTGVDAPRVLNLVFFKEVKSFAKFWQMIGRGTRKCPDIFGKDQDKEFFLIFDICGNFEYFDEFPDGYQPSQTQSLQSRLFEIQLDIVFHLQQQSEKTSSTLALEQEYLQQLQAKVQQLDEQRFEVRKHWEMVRKYKEASAWVQLSRSALLELYGISHLVSYTEDKDEMAKKFDLLLFNLNLALVTSDKKQKNYIANVMNFGQLLGKKLNIPIVKQREGIIKDIQTDAFWHSVDLATVEQIRTELREVVKVLKDEDKEKPIYTTIEDELNVNEVREMDLLENYTSLQSYKDRVEHFIRKNKHHLVIDKLYKNIPITPSELKSLEDFLVHQKFNLSDIEKEYETKSLGLFIRKVLGLDIQAANAHFARFIQEENLNADQMLFVEKIIHYLNKNGILDKQMLTQPPFNDQYDNGILGVFEEKTQVMKIIGLVDEISKNAGVA